MRARNLKPGFFKNEILGTADPLLSILFEGLWCLADRAGRLEDRPLRIKAEIFPYRDSVDIESMLAWLQTHAFIVRYSGLNGGRYIQVCMFRKHQTPHCREPDSQIPDPQSKATETGIAQVEHSASTSPAHLIPDSGFRIPDSGLRIPDTSRTSPAQVEHSAGTGLLHVEPSAQQLHAESLEAWREVEGIDAEAFARWLEHCEKLEPPKRLPAHVRLAQAKKLAGYGDKQAQAVKRCIEGGWRNLRPLEVEMAVNGGRKAFKPSPTTAELEALETTHVG